MSKTHYLKSWPEFFAPIKAGVKKFDLRFNDRNFEVGDILVFKEWLPNGDDGEYSGRETARMVSYIMHGVGPGGIQPMEGLRRRYCIMALMDVADICRSEAA